MRTTQLRVVIVMVVVRAFPNTAGAQNQDSKDPHQLISQPRMRQYRLVLAPGAEIVALPTMTLRPARGVKVVVSRR